MKCINWTLSDWITQRVWLVENLNFKIFLFFFHYLKKLLQLLEVLTFKLDHYNSLLYNVLKNDNKKLQSVQNAAARLITRSRKCDHITPILFNFHWLPVSERIKFKILLLTFKALHQRYPTYIQDLITHYLPSRSVRSSSTAQSESCFLFIDFDLNIFDDVNSKVFWRHLLLAS